MYHRKTFWMLTTFFVALCSLPLVAQTGGELNRLSSGTQTSIRVDNSFEPKIRGEECVSTEWPAPKNVPSAKVHHVWPVYGARCGFKTLLQAQVENIGSRPLPPGSMVCFWVNGLSPSGPCLVGNTPVLELHPETTRWYASVWSAPNIVSGEVITYQVQVCAGDTALSPLSDPRVVEFVNRNIGAPQAISPSDITLSETPKFIWKSVVGATWYVLKVYGPPGNAIKKWYRSEDVTQGAACVGRLTAPLPKGVHTWCIQPWSMDGYGQSSEKKRFNIG